MRPYGALNEEEKRQRWARAMQARPYRMPWAIAARLGSTKRWTYRAWAWACERLELLLDEKTRGELMQLLERAEARRKGKGRKSEGKRMGPRKISKSDQ